MPKISFELRFGFVAAEGEVEVFAAIEADEVGEETDLCGRPFAVGAVHLPVDVAGINEQHGVGAGRFAFALIQKPKSAGQRDGVKHVRADGDHHVHGAAFDELAADFLFGRAGVRSGVCHDESGAAFFIQRGIKKLNPEVIGVVGARQAKRKPAICANLIFQPLFIHGVDVERRIGEDEIKVDQWHHGGRRNS